MATYSVSFAIGVGCKADRAKRIKRTVRMGVGTATAETRTPTEVLPIDAAAGVAMETAAVYTRVMGMSGATGLVTGPRRIIKVFQVAAKAAIKVFTGGAGVYSYLRLRDEALDEEGFLTQVRHGPKGFTAFTRIYPGEYTFKDMVLRTTMLTRDPTTRPKLTRLKPIVDVPDRILQGTVAITDALAGADVALSPAFYSTPEVAVLWQSGSTVGIAYNTAPTRTGFNVWLEDAANPGTRITGTVSYMVQGY